MANGGKNGAHHRTDDGYLGEFEGDCSGVTDDAAPGVPAPRQHPLGNPLNTSLKIYKILIYRGNTHSRLSNQEVTWGMWVSFLFLER